MTRKDTRPRFTYAYGYRTRDDAWEAVLDMAARDEVRLSEDPDIAAYRTNDGKRRYSITLPMA